MSYVQILYLPRSERKSKGMPFGNMGDRVFAFPKHRTDKATAANGNGKRGQLEPIEMDYVVIKEGTNQVAQADWEAAAAYATHANDIKRLMSQSILNVFEPAEGKIGRTTADFEDFQDVTEIVNHCKNIEWLSFSLQIDTREDESAGGDVRQLIRDRLNELEEAAGVVRGGRLAMR